MPLTGWWETLPAPVIPAKTGWWAEYHADFSLAVSPTVSLAVRPKFALTFTPSLALAAAERDAGQFSLAVTPTVAAAASSRSAAAFSIAAQIDLGMTTTHVGNFALAVTPAVTFAAAEREPGAISVSVTPALALSGAGHNAASVNLAATPSIGITGADRQPGAVGLSVTPSLGMAATGHDGTVSVQRLGAGTGARSTTAVSGTITATWTSFNITASDANTVVIVPVAVSAGGTITDPTVTYGGVTMQRLQPAFNAISTGTSTSAGSLQFFYLFNPPTGAQTVSVAQGNTPTSVMGVDIAFSAVQAIGSRPPALATTQSLSLTAANGYALRALMNGAALSAPNQTSEYLNGGSVTGVGDYLAVQSAATDGSAVSFTATGTATSPASMAINLEPLSPTVVKLDTIARPATQPGEGASYAANISRTWTHTVAADADLAVVVLTVYDNSAARALTSFTRTVTIGGQTMTSSGSMFANNSTSAPWLEIFTLVNPPTGAQTVSVAVSSGTDQLSGAFASYTFKNVTSVTGLQTASGSGTSISFAYSNAGAVPQDLALIAMLVRSTSVRADPNVASDGLLDNISSGSTSTNVYSNGQVALFWIQPAPTSKTVTTGAFTPASSAVNWAVVSLVLKA
jgi:hypothetical protein